MAKEFQESLPGGYHQYDGQQYRPEPSGGYRSISPLAVAGLVFGVLSPLTFIHWGMFVLPLTAVILAVLALLRIERGGGTVRGAYLAFSGIGSAVVLSLGFYAYAVYLYRTQAPPGYLLVSYEALTPDRAAGEFIPESARDLVDRKVFLRGYMKGGDQAWDLKEFVLCRDNGDCSYCNPKPNPDDLVYVRMERGLTTDYTASLIGVGGVFTIKEPGAEKKMGGVFYYLEADTVR